MSQVIKFAKLINPNYFKLAERENKVQVLTIAFSHYCELAVWSLKAGNIPYQEHGFAPGQHFLPVLSVRMGTDQKYLSTSSRVTGVKEKTIQNSPELYAEDEERRKKALKKDKAMRSGAVPVAITPDGKVLLDSWAIAKSVPNLAPIDPNLQKLLDEEVGPLARQLTYSHILKTKNLHYFTRLCTENQGFFWNLIFKIYAGQELTKLMRKLFTPSSDPDIKQKSTERLQNVLNQIDQQYLQPAKAKGHAFLTGDKLSVGDIALASLFAPLITPPQYYGGKYEKIFTEFVQTDEDVRRDKEFWEKTAVGQFTLDLYKKHR